MKRLIRFLYPVKKERASVSNTRKRYVSRLGLSFFVSFKIFRNVFEIIFPVFR